MVGWARFSWTALAPLVVAMACGDSAEDGARDGRGGEANAPGSGGAATGGTSAGGGGNGGTDSGGTPAGGSMSGGSSGSGNGGTGGAANGGTTTGGSDSGGSSGTSGGDAGAAGAGTGGDGASGSGGGAGDGGAAGASGSGSSGTGGNPGTCGNDAVEGDEVCDDGTNDGSYDGCMPGCGAHGPHCGDGEVDSGYELCDGDCPSCTPNDACDIVSETGSAATCDKACQHTQRTQCVNGDGCCPASCVPINDEDCVSPVYDVDVCVSNTNAVTVTPSMIDAPFNSYARVRWHNVCSRTVWIVNFGSGTNWSQLAILGPGQSTTSSSVAEGPWCGFDFGGTYRLGGLAYPADDRAYLMLRCVR